MSGHRDYWQEPSDAYEHKPVFWWNGHGIYAAHLIAIVLAASMIVTSLMLFGSRGRYLDWLVFNPAVVLRGEVWRVATFGLVNQPSISFAIDMVMIVWFGREVERYLGRSQFLWLFAAAYFATPVVLLALSPWIQFAMAGKIGALAIFVAFATIYPGSPVFFGLLAKWAALIVLGIYTMMALAYRDTVLLISIWASCGAAYALVRHYRGDFRLPSIQLPQKKPRLRVLPDEPAKKDPDAADVDAILDKIANSGIQSLTAKERARLEEAGRRKRRP